MSAQHHTIHASSLVGAPRRLAASLRSAAECRQSLAVRRTTKTFLTQDGQRHVKCATSCNSRGLMTHHRHSVTRRQTMTVCNRQGVVVNQVRSSSHASCSSNRIVFNSGLHSLSAAVSMTDHVSVALCTALRYGLTSKSGVAVTAADVLAIQQRVAIVEA